MSGAGDSDTPSMSSSRSVRSPIGKSGGASKRGDHRVDEDGVIGGKYAERIADLVFKTGFADIDFDMPGFLL